MQKRTALLSVLLLFSSFAWQPKAAGYDVRLEIEGGAVILKDVPEGTYRASVTPQDGMALQWITVGGSKGALYPKNGQVFKMPYLPTDDGTPVVFSVSVREAEPDDVVSEKETAYDFVVNKLHYKILSDNKVDVVGSDAGIEGSVEVPGEVEYENNTFQVQSISYYAFRNRSLITQIIIKESSDSRQMRIGQQAFENCTSLQTLDFPVDLDRIEPSMINGCIGLTTIVCRSMIAPDVMTGTEDYQDVIRKQGIVLYYPDEAYNSYVRNSAYWKSYNTKYLSTYNPDKIFTLTLNLQGENDGRITLYDAQPGQKMQFIGASNSTAPVVRINRTKMALDEANTLTIPDNLPAGNLLLTLNDNSQTSSVEDVDTSPCYSVDGNILSVNSIDGHVVRVYNMLGECLFCGTDSELILSKGVYVVKTGNVAEKILIK